MSNLSGNGLAGKRVRRSKRLRAQGRAVAIDEVADFKFAAAQVVDQYGCARSRLERGIEEEIDPRAGREPKHAIGHDLRRAGLAIDRHHPRHMFGDAQAEDTGIGGVDDAQPQPLVGLDRKLQAVLAVERDVLAKASGHRRVVEIAEAALDGARVRQPPVVEYQHDIAVDVDGGALLDDQCAEQPARHLLGRQKVRMVPEGAGIGRREAVIETCARSDFHLGQMRHAVHGVGDAQAMPMNDGRLRQFVDQTDFEFLTLTGA